jgi:hypothetical protein
MDTPLAPALPPLGAGAHAIHLYYRYNLILVIQRRRNWGAIVAGRSPWSVSAFLVPEQEHFFDLIFGTIF